METSLTFLLPSVLYFQNLMNFIYFYFYFLVMFADVEVVSILDESESLVWFARCRCGKADFDDGCR